MGFEDFHNKALNSVNNMIYRLENDSEYYDADFEYEYTPFEEDIKYYCDTYCDLYISYNKEELFFDSLTQIVNNIVECNTDMYDEDFFRPAELITYYFGKIIISNTDLKKSVYDWLVEFSAENEGDMLVKDYFRHFVNGEKIYHADEYYTGYDDFKKMIRVFEKD